MYQRILFMFFITFKLNCFAALPQGFVYLHDIDPTIQVSLRYAETNNFIGKKIDGYKADNKVILTKEAAIALKKAQEIFNKDGYSIVVYDAYRPQRAVDNFVSWAKDINDNKMKNQYYPRVDKDKVFDLGYIAEKSSHSRGSTVDISLIEMGSKIHPIKEIPRVLQDKFSIIFLDDGSIDMGTSFDLFDKASHYDNDLIKPEHKLRRSYLKMVMVLCGFKEYSFEWWHFTLNNEPFLNQYFNFVIE